MSRLDVYHIWLALAILVKQKYLTQTKRGVESLLMAILYPYWAQKIFGQTRTKNFSLAR